MPPDPPRNSPVAVLIVLVLLATVGMAALAGLGSDGEPGVGPLAIVDGGSSVSLDANAGNEQGKLAAVELLPKKCKAARGGNAIFSGPKDEKVVALTFDDGPGDATAAFLDVLAEQNVNATFYVLGREIPGDEGVLRRAVLEGHSVANHSYNHSDLAEAGKLAEEEVEPTSELITKSTGVPPCTFRPPYGSYSPELEKYITDQGMDLLRWNIDTGDALGTGAAATLQDVKDNLAPGAIILMHDAGDNAAETLSVLPEMIDYIRGEGYEMVTIPELLGLQTDEPADAPESTEQVAVPTTPATGGDGTRAPKLEPKTID